MRQFVNTFDVESGVDELGDAAAVQAWFVEHDLLDAGARRQAGRISARVVELREALRALLLANNGEPLDPGAVEMLNAVAARRPLEARLRPDGHDRRSPVAAAGSTARSASCIAIVVQAVADGTWSRLKACREDECQWAFYDHSRNRSGQWCVMAVCGNRNKARSYRERQRRRD